MATLGRAMNPKAWSSGARVAQDQIWAKPPGASPLVFHRDSPYFDFVPDDVITVWIALDDMTCDELGPLEYVLFPINEHFKTYTHLFVPYVKVRTGQPSMEI